MTTMSNEKRLFCSRCKHSTYVLDHKEKKLRCEVLSSKGKLSFLPTDSDLAEECGSFARERWRDNLTTRADYEGKMRRCGVPLSEEENGALAYVSLL